MYAAHYGLSDVGALYEFTFYLLTYLLTRRCRLLVS